MKMQSGIRVATQIAVPTHVFIRGSTTSTLFTFSVQLMNVFFDWVESLYDSTIPMRLSSNVLSVTMQESQLYIDTPMVMLRNTELSMRPCVTLLSDIPIEAV